MASAKYDPARGAASTYYSTVINRRATDLSMANTRQCSDRSRERPLEHVAEVPAPGGGRDAWDLKLDLDDALARLPEGDRGVALALAEHGVAGVTRLTGLSRQAVRSARGRAGRRLKERGLP